MESLHPEAKPLIVTDEGKDTQVGWRVETQHFTFDAIEQEDRTVNTYVEWGDDQGGDMANHETWADVRRWLGNCLGALR